MSISATATASSLLLVLLVAANLRAEEVQAKVDPQAAAMMHKAHQARSGWGDDFPGFSARVTVNLDGEVTKGNVTVTSGGAVKLDLPEGQAAEWATQQLESIAMHRTAGGTDEYDVSFADDEREHPLGRLIRFHGGELHSLYRIKDDVITEVHRTMSQTKFTISVTDISRTPEGKTLPKHFNVTYWDAKTGELTSNKDYTVQWGRVDGVDVPLRRLMVGTSKGGRRVYELILRDHKLLLAK